MEWEKIREKLEKIEDKGKNWHNLRVEEDGFTLRDWGWFWSCDKDDKGEIFLGIYRILNSNLELDNNDIEELREILKELLNDIKESNNEEWVESVVWALYGDNVVFVFGEGIWKDVLESESEYWTEKGNEEMVEKIWDIDISISDFAKFIGIKRVEEVFHAILEGEEIICDIYDDFRDYIYQKL